MESASLILKYFDWLSICFGLGIFVQNNKWLRTFNSLRALMVIGISAYAAWLYGYAHEMASKKYFWFLLLTWFYFPTYIVYTIAFWMNRQAYANLLTTLIGGLTSKQRKTMKKTCIFVTIFLVTHFILYCSSYPFSNFGESTGEMIKTMFLMYQTDSFHHGSCLYFTIILMAYYSHKNILRHILKKVINHENICNDEFFKMSSLQLLSIQDNIRTINAVSGPILLINFTYIYIAVPPLGFLVKADHFGIIFMLVEVITMLLHILMTFILVILVQKLNAKLYFLQSEVLHEISRRTTVKNSHQRDLFMNLIQDKNLFTLTAMDMFNMDYGMLLSFGGSLINFTVLLCQINSSLVGS